MWPVVGDNVTKFCLDFLNGSSSVVLINHTNIFLILKVAAPIKISDCRTISLCNVLYKFISKAIANRLKRRLDDLISPFQGAFNPNRLISDDAAVAFQLMYSLKRRSNKIKGWLSMKLEMSKVYDKLEWGFLDEVLKNMGFSDC